MLNSSRARSNNPNLSGRLASLACILLVLWAAGATGQRPFQNAQAQSPAPVAAPGSAILAADQPGLIILLEGEPVSFFRQQFDRGAAWGEAEKSQIRAYSRQLSARQQQFVEAARRQGINLSLKRSFTYLLNGLAVSAPAGELARLAALPGVRGVYPDLPVQLELADSVPLIGADQVWQMLDRNGEAVTGQGIRLAVIDTGIDYTHPDLGGCFGPGCKVAGGYDLYNSDADPLDDNGHGTHCAGIAAADGILHGVAPGASLYAYKVLNPYGAGIISVIIAGIELAADPDQDPGTDDTVDIISMSLGVLGAPDDPWPLAVDAAVAQGIVVAVSAGNSGPAYGSIESPGVARRAITVGAADKLDQIAPFSSRGPIPGYDSWLKPDLLAPGVAITSTYLSEAYAAASGTSMAAPHVAGAAALIKQMHPDWSPDQVQSSLMNTATDLGLNVHTQGSGRIQVDRAIAPPGLVTPGSLSFGTVDLAQPLWSDTRLLWLENVSGDSLTYTLSAQGLLPASVTISVEPASITLAPGEKHSFSAVLAVDSRQTPPDLDRDQGWIRIQQGDQVLTVPFAFQTSPIFSDSFSLPFGVQSSYAAALSDLDGDGDLDAFIGNTSYYDNPPNTVWFNDGAGHFSDSGQRLGNAFTWDIALGDLDGDGDSDVFAANSEVESAQPDEIWLNDGHGNFADSGLRLGDSLSRAVSLGDLDGDGDLDAFIVNGITEHGRSEPDTVWLNDGAGHFNDSGQALGGSAGLDVALGDLDGDGDLDAFVANGDPQRVKNEPNTVWINDGQAHFSNSGQDLGSALSQAVALGDLDGDGDLDAFIANGGPYSLDGQPDELWLNDGSGVYSNSGLGLGSLSSYGAALADIHQDGSLDVFVAGYRGGNRLWLNDGNGNLTLSSPGFGTESAADVALGDIDGDGDIDALAANAIGQPNRLWLSRGSGGPPLERLPPPSDLLVITLPDGSLQQFWADHALDETSYHLERSSDNGLTWTEIAVLPADSFSHTDAQVDCEQTYFYRLRAYRFDDGLYSAYSHPNGATAGPCVSLAAPSSLTATTISASQIALAWEDAAADETAYLVERSRDGLTSWIDIAVLPQNSSTYSAGGLTCSTEYHFRVRAYRDQDQQYSSYSPSADAVTDSCRSWTYLPLQCYRWP